MAIAARIRGYLEGQGYEIPTGASLAWLHGRMDAAGQPKAIDTREGRSALVRRVLESGYRSGIDRLESYGLNGDNIVGYFWADRRRYSFTIEPDSISYRLAPTRTDSVVRRDRGAPTAAVKKKARTCKVGLECGATCINKQKTCRLKMQQQMQQEVDELRAKLAMLEAQLATERKPKEARPGDVRDENLSDLNFDPKRFQYKLLPGETGATGSLSGVRKWDPNLAGVVQVWKDPADGQTYIVNGHNRATLANRLGVDKVTVRYLDAKDAAEARAIGAITNIAEGRGSALDAAKFFRDTGLTRTDLENKGIPMREKIATDGLAIASLDDSLFRQVVDGRLPMQRASIIGGSGLDHTQQRALVEMVEQREKRGGKITNDTLSELTEVVRSSSTQTEFTLDLFGGSETQKSLAFEKAELQSKIRQRLSREKRLFSTVGRSRAAEELARAGNQINVSESANIAAEAQTSLRVFDQMKNMTSGISRLINSAAERVANGENKRTVERELYNEVLERISKGDY